MWQLKSNNQKCGDPKIANKNVNQMLWQPKLVATKMSGNQNMWRSKYVVIKTCGD
jgi:hypothetical protein